MTAVEPGEQLIARARDQLQGLGDVRFVHSRLEQAELPRAHYVAVLSASAIHWVDPEVSWRKAADVLLDGGTLALFSYFGLDAPRSREDQRALRDALVEIAPELAGLPAPRNLEATLAGVAERRENVSEVWAWLGSHDIGRTYAAALFRDVAVAAVPTLVDQTAEELNALLGTTSFWARLSPPQQDALASANQALHRRLGRAIRSDTIACLVAARRAAR